jgi:hypothetical protein
MLSSASTSPFSCLASLWDGVPVYVGVENLPDLPPSHQISCESLQSTGSKRGLARRSGKAGRQERTFF